MQKHRSTQRELSQGAQQMPRMNNMQGWAITPHLDEAEPHVNPVQIPESI